MFIWVSGGVWTVAAWWQQATLQLEACGLVRLCSDSCRYFHHGCSDSCRYFHHGCILVSTFQCSKNKLLIFLSLRITGVFNFLQTSGVLRTIKHNILETGSLSSLRRLGPLERVNWNSGQSKFKSYCVRRSVGQFVLVSGLLWSRWPDFTLPSLTRGRICNLQCNHASSSSSSSYIATDGQSASSSWYRVVQPKVKVTLV
jgi:hypothetical protein